MSERQHNAEAVVSMGNHKIVQTKVISQIVGRLPDDDGGLTIRVSADHLPPELINLPVGAVIVTIIEATDPPTIHPFDDEMKARVKEKWGIDLDHQETPRSD